MDSQFELVSVLVAAQYVLVAGIVFLLLPFDVVAPALPLALVFLFALHKYRVSPS